MATPSNSSDALSQALAEPSRRTILEQLRLGKRTVSELVAATGLKQPNVSNHLAKMRAQHIVFAERTGRHVYYSIAQPIADVMLRLHEFANVSLEQSAGNSERDYRSATPTNGAASSHRAEHPDTLRPDLEEAQESFLRSILEGHEGPVNEIVNGLLAERVSLTDIYVNVFQQSLFRIGDLYLLGEVNEAQEHLATALTERMMAKVAQFYTPVASLPYKAILGCVAGAWHALGLRMLSDALRSRGWDTLFLGANVPTDSFVAMANLHRPNLVVISCPMAEQRDELILLVDRLREMRSSEQNPPFEIVIGGRYVNEHSGILGEVAADATASDLVQFLDYTDARFPMQNRTTHLV